MLNKLIGVVLIVAAFAVEISWLAFCFGSVLIGILLLIFAPAILFAPFNILFTLGLAFLARGSLGETEFRSYSYRYDDRSTDYDSYYNEGYRQEPPAYSTYDTGMKKYYDVLGCSQSDDFDTIKKAYKDLSRKFHPDAVEGKGLSDEFVTFATERMQEINEAYHKIKEARGL